MRRLTPLALVCAALAVAAACARVQASTPGPSPLDVPAPPPRVVVPPNADVSDPLPPAAPEAPLPMAPARPRDTSAPPARTPDKPTTTTPPATPPPPPEATPPRLETTPDVKTLEQQTRALLASAKKDLDRVDSRTLSSDARAQYQLALQFAKEAQTALNEKNLTYARNMAEKAAALASQLPKTGSSRVRLAPWAVSRPTAP